MDIAINIDYHLETPENANIKEKLNLHVKRRLQESDDVPSQHIDEASMTSQHSQQSPSLKPKVKKGGPKTKKAKAIKLEEDSSSNIDKDDLTTAESPNQAKDKQQKAPCILDVILNSKKVSLMKDPEVVEFLRNLTQTIKQEQ